MNEPIFRRPEPGRLFRHLVAWSLVAVFQFCSADVRGEADPPGALRAGLARVCITPEKPLWLHGYAGKPRFRPFEGKLNDLYAKAMALEDARGERAVQIAVDLCVIRANADKYVDDARGLVADIGFYSADAEQTLVKAVCALEHFSHDNGRTWSDPCEHNFPMASSKIYAGLLSTGQRYLLCNLPASRRRDLLVVAVSRPGEKAFVKMWKIRDGHAPALKAGPEWSYPCAVEAEGKLYVVCTSEKHHCAMTMIPVESLVALASPSGNGTSRL